MSGTVTAPVGPGQSPSTITAAATPLPTNAPVTPEALQTTDNTGTVIRPQSATDLLLESAQAVVSSGIKSSLDLGDTAPATIDSLAARVAMLEVKLASILKRYYRGEDWVVM
jgi:hypothetical protein